MTVTTRNRSRDPNVKPSSSRRIDREETVDFVPDTSGDNNVPDNAYQSYTRDQASRLSEEFQPMNLNNQTPLHEQVHEAVGEIDILGLHVKAAISTINRLESLGLQRLKIPLPKIVVLGEQSTGKSSVIEAISGIKTPRATGTCTRCPLFIKLEPSDDPQAEWIARVTLRRDFSWDGKTGRGHERRFQGWASKPQPTIVEFATTNNPHNLAHIIDRAQMATISPMVDHFAFLQPSVASLDAYHRCEFSPNVVCISITGPNLPALSFYDLPGIISQADTAASQYLVKFVKDLVVDYVKDPEALILVTCSLETDIANSTAGGIARELKATDRCIGILTKPDRLPKGTRPDTLRQLFDGKRFTLGHGYFVVRNLGQHQLDVGLSHRDARQQEQQFFEDEDMWAKGLREYSARFGTRNLQSYLSGKLAEQITMKIPIIHDEINARLHQVEGDLEQYPEPPTHNATRIIFDLVLEFSQHVRKEVEAEYPCKEWRNNWQGLQTSLFKSLLDLKPTMTTLGKRDGGIYMASFKTGRSINHPLVLDTDDDDDDDADGDVQMPDNPETPSKKRKMEGTPAPSPLKTPASRPHRPITADGTVLAPNFSEKRTKFHLDTVATYLSDTSKSKIPGQIEPRVVNDMMLRTLDNWQLPLCDFFDNLEQQLRSQIKVLFHEYFGKWEGSALYKQAWKVVMEMLNSHLAQQRITMANESLRDEQEGPYIFHSDIFTRDKEAILQYYHEARVKTRLALYKKERQFRTGKVMSPAEEEKLKKDSNLMALLHQEPYTVELGVVAEVVTYYMLAARRFHDSICMRIESKFFKHLRTHLRDELENGLGIHDETEGHRNAIRLLAEQSVRAQQRRELVTKRESLLQGKQVLCDLQRKKYDHRPAKQTSSAVMSDDLGQSSFGMPTPLPEETEEEM